MNRHIELNPRGTTALHVEELDVVLAGRLVHGLPAARCHNDCGVDTLEIMCTPFGDTLRSPYLVAATVTGWAYAACKRSVLMKKILLALGGVVLVVISLDG
eukprot:2873868-Amphidinium_carterae.1